MHRENLEKLRDYLVSLPEDYEYFDMGIFYAEEEEGVALGKVPQKTTCGTVACAVGHGPAAGIMPLEEEYWLSYAIRNFGEDAYFALFSGAWAEYDNTLAGAIDRINKYLAGEHIVIPWIDIQEYNDV